MNNEVELARIAMWSDLIKMFGSTLTTALKELGPAVLTGLFGYLAGRLDFKGRLLNMKSQQEFSAREIMLSLKKERFERIMNSASAFQETIGKMFGEYLGSKVTPGEGLPIEGANAFFKIVVPEMLDDVRFVETELSESDAYKKQETQVTKIKEDLESYQEPSDVQGVLDAITMFSGHFGVLAAIATSSLEQDMKDMFDKYLE